MQLVELVDTPASGDASGPETAERPRRGRRRGVWVVAGLVLVAALMAGGQAYVDRRERDAIARLAQVPGVIAPVGDQLVVARKASIEDFAGLVGDSGGLETAAGGSQSYSWSGGGAAVRWTAQLLGATPTLAQKGVSPLSYCVPDVPDGAETSTASQVVCYVTDGGWRASGDGQASTAATTSRVVVLDTRDGSVLGDWPVGQGVWLVLSPGRVVVETWDASGAKVSAHDRLTGATKWTYTASTSDPSGAYSGPARSVGDDIVLQLDERTVIDIGPDGKVRREIRPKAEGRIDWWDVEATSGRVVVTTIDQSSLVLAPDLDPSGDVTLRGTVVHAQVDDGSVPDLAVTQDTDLRAWDLSTGEQQWNVELTDPASSAIVMRGRLYVATGDGVLAFNARTGERLWHGSVEGGLPDGQLYTDGTHILTPVRPMGDETRGTVLVAYDAVTGKEAFRAPFPKGFTSAGSAGRQLLGVDDAGTTYVLLK